MHHNLTSTSCPQTVNIQLHVLSFQTLPCKVDFLIKEMAFPEGDIVEYAECIEVIKVILSQKSDPVFLYSHGTVTEYSLISWNTSYYSNPTKIFQGISLCCSLAHTFKVKVFLHKGMKQTCMEPPRMSFLIYFPRNCQDELQAVCKQGPHIETRY